jgi:hypothetical protein
MKPTLAANPAEVLSTFGAVHVIATSILFDRCMTLWAILGIGTKF